MQQIMAVISPTCTTESIDVNLGAIDVADLAIAGAQSTKIPFSITLEGCPANDFTKPTVVFDGTHDSTDQGLLGLTITTGVATNVAIAIYNRGEDSKLPLGEHATTVQPSEEGIAIFEFDANYVATGTATPGSANGVATFQIVYH